MIMITYTILNLKTDNEDTEVVVDNFCLLGLTLSKTTSSPEILCRLPLGRIVMKALEKIFRYCDMFIASKI